MRPPRILVAHPGRQHSDQLAWALHEAGMLAKYIHGSPLSAAVRAAIPPDKRQFLPLATIARRLVRPVKPRAIGAELAARSDMMFDWLVARKLAGGYYDAVIGYEVGCAAIAAAAKRANAAFILDAASVHHAFQDAQMMHSSRPEFHAAVRARKDREIAAADLVITCSRLAARTFVHAGIEPGKVIPIALGIDTGTKLDQPDASIMEGHAKLLFIGRLSAHKGADLLVSAVEALAARGQALELTVVTDKAMADPALLKSVQRIPAPAVVQLLPFMSQAELVKVYRRHDVLVLPSRFDSFGLVVPEAQCQGCAVVVSPNVGSADLVADGVSGICMQDGSAGALSCALSSMISDISSWRSRRPYIRELTRELDWKHYRASVAEKIFSFMAARAEAVR